MRISDWSSDVCSSDLCGTAVGGATVVPRSCRAEGFFSGGAFRTAAERLIRSQCREPEQGAAAQRSEEHTSELQSLMRISYAVFCLEKKHSTNDRTYARPDSQLPS